MRKDLGRGWYISSHTTTNYAYKQTSFNLGRQVTMLGPRTGGEISFQVKYRWTRDGGFWFGVRPHMEIKRNEARLRAEGEKWRHARSLSHCDKCGREEWGEPGLGLPKDWEYVRGPHCTVCRGCAEKFTLAELLKPDREEVA